MREPWGDIPHASRCLRAGHMRVRDYEEVTGRGAPEWIAAGADRLLNNPLLRVDGNQPLRTSVADPERP